MRTEAERLCKEGDLEVLPATGWGRPDSHPRLFLLLNPAQRREGLPRPRHQSQARTSGVRGCLRLDRQVDAFERLGSVRWESKQRPVHSKVARFAVTKL